MEPIKDTPPDGGKEPVKEPGKTFSQAEIDSIVEERLARDRRTREESLQKDLGMSLKDAKEILKAKRAAEDAAKTEMERLTGERDTLRSESQAARIEAMKLRALVRAGIDPEKIDAMLKRVVGSTAEEIEADIAELKKLGLISQPAKQSPATGAGQNAVPQNAPEKSLEERIAEYEKAGRYDLSTPLKLKLQQEKFKG